MKKNKISKNWINKQRRDIYVRQSKVEGYRSRAVYKLKEINEKFKFLKNNISVIDLGAAPGSWSQYISSNLKCNKHLAMDLKEIESLIKEGLPDAKVEIQDLAGDGNHYSATVTSSEFSGKSKIEQHKMVYNSLKGKMGNELHALAIKTKEI